MSGDYTKNTQGSRCYMYMQPPQAKRQHTTSIVLIKTEDIFH